MLEPFPDVHPDWTINGGENPQRPRMGRVTVVAVVSGPDRDIRPGKPPQEFSTYAVLRRLADRYGSRGLDVVLLTQTRGYSVGSLVQTEEEELKSMEDLYFKWQKIPATLLVNKTTFNKLPDGRFIPNLTPWMKNFGSGVLIVDQKGVIRWFTYGVYEAESQIDAYIESLLASGAAIRSANTGTEAITQINK